jgi:transposase
LEDQEFLKVYFGDESGFCLNPSVPYGWQPSGKYTAIVPKKSKRINIFGLLSRDNDFEAYETKGAMNAELLVAYIDDFATRIKQKSVIVLDNAPFHHAQIVLDKIEHWRNNDLYIWFLPKYSPHLNRIETLWRKIKYEWLKPHDYDNWESFNLALEDILINVGTKYKIKFS